MNKVVIWLIVVLFVISIGAGAFTIVLNGKIGTLDSDTQAFKSDTAGQFSTVKSSITSVDSSLTGFKTDTTSKFTGVQSDITGVRNNVTGLNSDLSAFKSDTTSKLNSAQSSINTLNTDLTNLGTQVDESTMNVRQVYDDVIGSVCQIIGNTAGGSGFIYSSSGYIITCWHVINGQLYLDVILHDGTCKRATVVGSDQDSDVAVIKISGVSNLKPLPLADSSKLVPGEPVIVVGNPHWIFESATYGVISRTKGIVYSSICGCWITNIIQYDAATNTGNSGGPVFNNKGEVIGIAAYSEGSGEGINYAVSSNKIKRVVNAIINDGSFTNATLPGSDWSISDLTPELAIAEGLDSTFGAVFNIAVGVGEVQKDDIVTAIDGVIVTEWPDIFSYIAEFKSVGDTITFTVIRNGTEREAKVVLVEGWVF